MLHVYAQSLGEKVLAGGRPLFGGRTPAGESGQRTVHVSGNNSSWVFIQSPGLAPSDGPGRGSETDELKSGEAQANVSFDSNVDYVTPTYPNFP